MLGLLLCNINIGCYGGLEVLRPFQKCFSYIGIILSMFASICTALLLCIFHADIEPMLFSKCQLVQFMFTSRHIGYGVIVLIVQTFSSQNGCSNCESF